MAATLTVTVTKQARFRVPRLGPETMRALGQQIITLNIARWDRAVNAADQDAKPLSFKVAKSGNRRGYAIQKQRKTGRNRRDWWLTGALRASFQVIEAVTNRVRVGWNDGRMIVRMRFNQGIDQMFGISPSDEAVLTPSVGQHIQQAIDQNRSKAA
jgi:hypothetical protein